MGPRPGFLVRLEPPDGCCSSALPALHFPPWLGVRWEKLPAWLRDYINIPFPVLSGVVVHAPSTQQGEMVSSEFKDSLAIVIKSCLTKSTTRSSRSHSLSLELSQQEPGNREHPPRGQDKAEEERNLPADPVTCPQSYVAAPWVFCHPLP